ncbi:PREDICTED: basic 7S globulin [Prunus dulcis]|uniref:PREDICTED: basic 7S globulin n=1 Tax=Prunus dulcis TaxID=3755 RepID=A0A5E4FV18_PRUDU|nr:probable aspartic proteinase GIP2 [Prunus dulcis]VVA31314.1 PREDICTED: basic 7S globulin [Prunus dulcis]
MAASLHFFHLLLLISFFLCNLNLSLAKPSHPPNGLIFHVSKDVSTLQYMTTIHHGTPLVPTKLVVDLGGPFLWLNCGSSSSPSRLISQGSIQCLAAKPKIHDLGSKNYLSSNDNNNKCHVFPENSINQMATQGELVQDIMAIQVIDGSSKTESGSITTLDSNFLFSCAPMFLLNGLASGARGMLGLGRTQISMASQISAKLSSKLQFMLCLSSSNGVILHNNGHFVSEISNSLTYTYTYTPFLTNQHEYFINLKYIKISGKRLSLNKEGFREGIKLSTTVPYTTMESSVYVTFTRAYEQAAMAMNMTRVAPVAPFGLCFSSEQAEGRGVGPKVPAIDLVLQSEMVKWRIHGRNSMVQVSNQVMCLGFLDGGSDLKTSIVIGGYQLEDTLLHFDLSASVLGFSSQTSCSDLRLDFALKDSL